MSHHRIYNILSLFSCLVLLVGCGNGEALQPENWKAGKVNGAILIADASAKKQTSQDTKSEPIEEIGEVFFENESIAIHQDDTYHTIRIKKNVYGEESAKKSDYRIVRNPQKEATPYKASVAGITLDGTPLETHLHAAWEENHASGWTFEPRGIVRDESLDEFRGHRNNDGGYHLHDWSVDVREGWEGTHIGYAADGHQIHYFADNRYLSSWRLKNGRRPSGADGPDGEFDGTYTRDYEYIETQSLLDACNGTEVNGSYTYIITEEFPRIPRCLYGFPDDSFNHGVSTGRGPSSLTMSPPNPAFEALTHKDDVLTLDDELLVDAEPNSIVVKLSQEAGLKVSVVSDILGSPPYDTSDIAKELGIKENVIKTILAKVSSTADL